MQISTNLNARRMKEICMNTDETINFQSVKYVNLTNGLKAIDVYGLSEYRFIRIQSTWCEQKKWEDILFTISDDFLMHLAQGGYHITIYDASGSNRPDNLSRAQWQGIEWIVYATDFRWRLIKRKCKKGMHKAFGKAYDKLSRRCRRRLDYFMKYLTPLPNIVQCIGVYINEGDRDIVNRYTANHLEGKRKWLRKKSI